MMQPVVTDVPWSVFVCLLVMTVSCAKVAEPVEMLSVCVVCTEPVCTLACALLLFLAVVSHCSLCWLSAVTESLHQCIRHRHSPRHLSETAGSWLCLQGTCLLCLFITHVSFIRHLQKDMRKSLSYIFYGVSRRWPPPTTLALTTLWASSPMWTQQVCSTGLAFFGSSCVEIFLLPMMLPIKYKHKGFKIAIENANLSTLCCNMRKRKVRQYAKSHIRIKLTCLVDLQATASATLSSVSVHYSMCFTGLQC